MASKESNKQKPDYNHHMKPNGDAPRRKHWEVSAAGKWLPEVTRKLVRLEAGLFQEKAVRRLGRFSSRNGQLELDPGVCP